MRGLNHLNAYKIEKTGSIKIQQKAKKNVNAITSEDFRAMRVWDYLAWIFNIRGFGLVIGLY